MIKVYNYYSVDEELISYAKKVRKISAERFKRFKKGGDFNITNYIINGGRCAVYVNNGVIRGISLGRLVGTIWDDSYVMFYQDILWGDTPRASSALLKDMIDFAKINADAMLTMTNKFTNLKDSSLIKLGFSKLDTNYILEA